MSIALFQNRDINFFLNVLASATVATFVKTKSKPESHQVQDKRSDNFIAKVLHHVNPSLSYAIPMMIAHFKEGKVLVENNSKNRTGYEKITLNADAISRLYTAFIMLPVSILFRKPMDWLFKIFGSKSSSGEKSSMKTIFSYYTIVGQSLLFRRKILHAAKRAYIDLLEADKTGKYKGNPFKIALHVVVPKFVRNLFLPLNQLETAKKAQAKADIEELNPTTYSRTGENRVGWAKGLIDFGFTLGSFLAANENETGWSKIISCNYNNAMIEGNSMAKKLKDGFTMKDIIPAEDRMVGAHYAWLATFVLNASSQWLLHALGIHKLFKNDKLASGNLRELVSSLVHSGVYMTVKPKLQSLIENFMNKNRAKKFPFAELVKWYTRPCPQPVLETQ